MNLYKITGTIYEEKRTPASVEIWAESKDDALMRLEDMYNDEGHDDGSEWCKFFTYTSCKTSEEE